MKPQKTKTYEYSRKYREDNPDIIKRNLESFKIRHKEELAIYYKEYNDLHAENRKIMSRIQREAKTAGMSYKEYKAINYPEFSVSLDSKRMELLRIKKIQYTNGDDTDIDTTP